MPSDFSRTRGRHPAFLALTQGSRAVMARRNGALHVDAAGCVVRSMIRLGSLDFEEVPPQVEPKLVRDLDAQHARTRPRLRRNYCT